MFYQYPNKVNHMELIRVLSKTYTKYGLTADEFIVLNAYCMHSNYYQECMNLVEIEQMTGKTEQEIKDIFTSLLMRDKIELTERNINTEKLYRTLNAILESEKSISERIAESIECNSYRDHMGMVELIPYQDGVAVTERSDHYSDGNMWSRESMIKLANEILAFTDVIDDDFVNQYNAELKAKIEKQREIDRQREAEREAEKKKREIPKSGYLFILQFPDSTNKFTYTTSLLKEQKTENIKFEYGDTVQIVHVLETYDTMKFFHQFIKKQFSNRLVEGTSNIYKLTDDDIRFLREEKFPANAMEWLEGPNSVRSSN